MKSKTKSQANQTEVIINLNLEDEKIIKKHQLLHIGIENNDQDVFAIAAKVKFTKVPPKKDSQGLREYEIESFNLEMRPLCGQVYEFVKCCKVIGSKELIVELQPAGANPCLKTDWNFDPIRYQSGEKLRFSTMMSNSSLKIGSRICQIFIA
ncbi:MAG: hypothetical protein KKC03_12425 [Bacteroidetes bacterium]|nr:hypothetical protein [Bacteroidota bacterium]